MGQGQPSQVASGTPSLGPASASAPESSVLEPPATPQSPDKDAFYPPEMTKATHKVTFGFARAAVQARLVSSDSSQRW